MSLSLRLSPQLLTTITLDSSSFGAILIASAKECAGSKLGEISSSSVTSLYAEKASSSVATVYLALPTTYKKQ